MTSYKGLNGGEKYVPTKILYKDFLNIPNNPKNQFKHDYWT